MFFHSGADVPVLFQPNLNLPILFPHICCILKEIQQFDVCVTDSKNNNVFLETVLVQIDQEKEKKIELNYLLR